jgi:hypothetical protein
LAYLIVRFGADRIIRHAPNSRDCNPIENLNGILSQEMKSSRIYANEDELWTAIQLHWDKLDYDRETLENLALSMPNRYREVLDKNGGSIHY